MTTHPFDILTLENGAQLIFTPCPGTKEATLVDAVSTLKQAGTEMLITLMFDEEMEKLSAQSLPKVCAENNIVWLQLPILDDAAPNQAFESQWQAHKASILEVINNKGTIAVHCKGGSGRTGLVIGLILAAYGYSADNVIEAVQKIRPNSLKNPTQLDYFNSQI
ncbi:dual specificity protein phosphatase family protein [Thalassotalea sp. SU-HH00458]|uniref:phosphatase domain-containing protein n=1 Tax=Thalassotalea sp. SU-HH00458 TaxID=3127657 RepID=UPI0031049A78